LLNSPAQSTYYGTPQSQAYLAPCSSRPSLALAAYWYFSIIGLINDGLFNCGGAAPRLEGLSFWFSKAAIKESDTQESIAASPNLMHCSCRTSALSYPVHE